MYLLFLDESGTHGTSPVFVLGGLAIAEADAWHLQQKVESFLSGRLTPLSLNAQNFELHANPVFQGAKEWGAIGDRMTRISILHGAFSTICNFRPHDARLPLVFFAAAVDREKQPNRAEREKWAYELVLKKFDDMLRRVNRQTAMPQRGLVIHDQRVMNLGDRTKLTAEEQIVAWTRDWREAAGRLGTLRHFADIPLFADSKATRLLQLADLACWAVWRQYGLRYADQQWLRKLWPLMDGSSSGTHGMIHMSRDFALGTCPCPPCRVRCGLTAFP